MVVAQTAAYCFTWAKMVNIRRHAYHAQRRLILIHCCQDVCSIIAVNLTNRYQHHYEVNSRPMSAQWPAKIWHTLGMNQPTGPRNQFVVHGAMAQGWATLVG